MKIYLVGGAVRDKLLGREVTERDYVVVSATPKEMLDLGFRQVGKDFPVFLHPETNEEYALARTERKTGKGYTGFECNADPSVTLEEDLIRRDLTINAMAQEVGDSSNAIIDPYHGQLDLKKKILRHISSAFSEDPVRILRVARFASRFPDYTVFPETNDLMKKMVETGEVDALVAERVWKEFSRALSEENPLRFFEVLNDCGALKKLFPEIISKGSLATSKSLDYLHRALTDRNPNDLIRFGSLALGLDKYEITSFCQRLKPPSRFSELAILVSSNLSNYISLDFQNAESVINFLEKIDAYRRPERFSDFCQILKFLPAEISPINSTQIIQDAFELTNVIDSKQFIDKGLKGEEIGKAIHGARVEKLQQGTATGSAGIGTR